MKKILGITMAAVCALSVAAFGISACGSKDVASDEVTAEEWAAALAETNLEANFYNVTINFTANESSKVTGSDGSEEVYNYEASGGVKVALTAADSYVTGNTYMYHNWTDSYTSSVNSEDNYSDSESDTAYEVFTDESYSFVGKEIYSGSDGTEEYWDGYLSNVAHTADYSDTQEITDIISDFGIEEVYSYFTYSDGAYRYSMTEDGVTGTAVVKINDGYLTYFLVEVKYEDTYTWSSVDYTGVYSEKYEFNISDYGTTSVTVPEEYTYEYYLANHAD